MTKQKEATQLENADEVSGSALSNLVMFLFRCLWKVTKWSAPRLAVIAAIGFAVTWGGLFHEDFYLVKGLTSWAVIWSSIDYYRWHLNTYET